jgi:hypothetical protein
MNIESEILKMFKTKDIDQKGFGDLKFNFQNINRIIIKDPSFKKNYIVSFEFKLGKFLDYKFTKLKDFILITSIVLEQLRYL